MKTVMVVAPHGDDESLGMAGTIARLKDDEIHWVIGTEEDKPYEQVFKFLGFAEYHKLRLPDGKLDTCDFGVIISKLATLIHEIKPETIFMPYRHDVHSDHRVMAEAVLAITKPFRTPFVKTILMYEVLSETEWAQPAFQPNVFYDINYAIEKKIEAVEMYKLEQHLSTGKVRAQSLMCGAKVNLLYAEAFQLVRQIR